MLMVIFLISGKVYFRSTEFLFFNVFMNFVLQLNILLKLKRNPYINLKL